LITIFCKETSLGFRFFLMPRACKQLMVCGPDILITVIAEEWVEVMGAKMVCLGLDIV
jgi:hypothetical protein